MGFWITLLWWAGSTLVSELLGRTLTKKAQGPRISVPEAEQFGGVTTTPDRPIPALWGTRALKSPALGWVGGLTQTPIVQNSATVGYKYYMGAQYVFCMGELDEIREVRFNDKPVGVGITDSNNQVVFANAGPPWFTAKIATGLYADGGSLALAIEQAMKAAQAGDWRVTFGFQIVSGVNDQVKVSIAGGAVKTCGLRPGKYTGTTLATELARALNDGAPLLAYGTTWACSYDPPITGPALKFTISFTPAAPVPGLVVQIHPSTAKSTLGFRHDITHVATPDLLGAIYFESDYQVRVSRFIFAFAGTTATLKCTDAGFTAASVLGINTGADKSFGIVYSDTDFSVIAVTFTDQGDYLQADLDDASFFGTEGGVQGRLNIYFGSPTQAASSYLTSQWGAAAPGFRRICHAVQMGVGGTGSMYVGNTNIPKPISIAGSRWPNPLSLTGEQHRIGEDANPACILYELLTDPAFRIKVPVSSIDLASFQGAAATLYAEGLGMSYLLENPASARDAVRDILRHIDGVFYEDPFTAAIKLKLARQDYTEASLPIATKSNARNVLVKRASLDDTKNLVRITYRNRARKDTDDVFPLPNLASIQARNGEVSSEDLRFDGISTEANAQKVAARALRILSAPPDRVEGEVNRELWDLRPGSPLKLVWPGQPDMIVRVTQLSPGTIDEEWVHFDAVVDAFGPIEAGYGLGYGQYYGGN